jgi:2-desacetyl-2-hydroxyethyl bacteriochlorophyllide A dehydrogenase
MLAGCYLGDGKVAVQEHEHRPPGPGEVEVEVAYTGLCGTDLHVVHGAMDSRVKIPAVLGHEMSGTVSALGEGVHGFEVGERVVVVPLDWCGRCPACRAGNTHICQNLNFIGIDSPGSLQGRWNVPERTPVRVPDGVSLEQAALAEPTAVAVHDVRRGGVVAGEQALVVGGGPIGLLIAAVARHLGADVVVLEVSEQRRAIAGSLGLAVRNPADGDVAAFVEDWTAGAGAAVCFEVSSSVDGLETAVSSLAVRGRLVLVAIHAVPRTVNLHRFFWRELSLIGARVYERRDFEEALDLIAAGAIPTAELTTSVVPIGDLAGAFETLAGGGAMKLLVDCSSAR